MLLRRATLRGIKDGAIRLAFRRWKRPTVKAGGTLLTAIGQLGIEAVDIVDESSISLDDARAAGYDDLGELSAQLNRSSGGRVYRIRLGFMGEDPRIALRNSIPSSDENHRLIQKLDGLDGRSSAGPWTHQTLNLIATQPGIRAGDLALAAGLDKATFKLNVRKLKKLGFTESLDVGYRLSPRGQYVLDAIRSNLDA